MVTAFPNEELINYVQRYQAVTRMFKNNPVALKRLTLPSTKFNLVACEEIDQTGFELDENEEQEITDCNNFLAAVYNN